MKIKPMLAEKSIPFDNDKWLFEIKWDGMRAEATIENEKICKLETRTGQDISSRFPELIGTHVKADQAIIDGEIICLDEKGMPSFSKLAHRSHLQNNSKIALGMKIQPCNYAVFDAMELNGRDLTKERLIDRKAILETIINKDDGLIPSLYIQGQGIAFFENVVKMGYEGVMGKKINSQYLPGKRSDVWLKIKPRHSTICEITGYNLGEGHRARMGALLISEQGVERGKVGSGLMDKDIDKLLSILQPVGKNNGSILVVPTTQIEISYFERTEAGHFRFPAFKKIL
jgi:bifunctional non-homologous end joining protein LigD